MPTRVPTTQTWLQFYTAALEGLAAASIGTEGDRKLLSPVEAAQRAEQIADEAEQIYQRRSSGA